MTSKFTRRSFQAGLITAAATTLLPASAGALSAGQAESLVNKAVNEINRVIASGKSESAMIRDFEKIFVKYGDVPIIARSALGRDARSASPAQIKAFTKAFQGYMARKYGKRFRDFIGGRIDVKGAAPVKSFVEVRTLVRLPGDAPFEVEFLVSDKSGRPKFFNIIIAGVNLLVSERAEIGAMIDKRRGNLNKMIADLKRAG